MKYMKVKPIKGDIIDCKKCNKPIEVTEVMIKSRRYWCKCCLKASRDKYTYTFPRIENLKINGTFLKDSQMAVVEAYKLGYDVVDGVVCLNGTPCKTRINKDGYLIISIRYNHRPFSVFVHRVVAYKKYKEQVFGQCLQVRHLDGIPNNNMAHNIALGTAKDNSDDKKNYHLYRKL